MAVLFVALIAMPAVAMDLQQARKSGMIGEKLNGYTAVVKSSPDANDLVQSVNAKRRQEYERISKQNGQPVDVVGRIAAEQIINGLAPGSLYESPAGGWKTR